jgi:spermidine synthase
MRLRERLWNPYILVFTSNACIMVIELVASRLIAPRVGVSLYTWTSVIGVILAGISLGNYMGGRLADRRASTTLLGTVFATASVTTLLILWLNNDVHDYQLPFQAPFMLWVVIYIAIVFFLPSVILGCVSPIIVKLSLTELSRTGRTVGKIYAWSAIGSIVGTFATGFWLISAFGTKTVILMVASLLMVLGIWFLTDASWRQALWRAVLALAVFGGGIVLLQRNGYLASEYTRETNYFSITVSEREADGRTLRQLVLDRLVHSYTDIDDPTYLQYGYERTYAAIIADLAEENPDLEAFFIGGGGYTFPRYMEATVPESHLVVTEIDPEVTEVAHSLLGLSQDTDIVTHNMDARRYLTDHAEADAYDVVFGDAFNDYSVPYHLTTLEFARLVNRTLRDDGLYMANIIDGGPRGHFLRAFVRTLGEVWEHVSVIPSISTWQDATRSTFVIVASHHPFDLTGLGAGAQPLREAELAAYLALEPPVILTDDYVPVDNLMAGVVNDSFSGEAVDDAATLAIVQRLIVGGVALAVLALAAIIWWIRRKVVARRASASEGA